MKSITIVGGGLVGSLLAVLLAKRGHKVDVYERRDDPRKAKPWEGRSINLVVSHRGWAALRLAGLEEAVRKITVPVYARMTHDPEGRTNQLAYSIDHKANWSVSRGELNNRLLDEAERVPGVTLHFGHRCEDVDLDRATCTFSRKGAEPVASTDRNSSSWSPSSRPSTRPACGRARAWSWTAAVLSISPSSGEESFSLGSRSADFILTATGSGGAAGVSGWPSTVALRSSSTSAEANGGRARDVARTFIWAVAPRVVRPRGSSKVVSSSSFSFGSESACVGTSSPASR